MTYISAELRRVVYDRAKGCCEYCLVHENDSYIVHEVDHVISEKHRGTTTEDNLCLSCMECNRFKGSDIGSIDVETKQFTGLFNPRSMNWELHFRLDNEIILTLTSEARVTEFLLRLNNAERLMKRRGLMRFHRYPCP